MADTKPMSQTSPVSPTAARPGRGRKAWLGYGLLALLSYLGFLLTTLPAAQAYHLLAPVLEPVRLHGLQGSLWAGEATALTIQGLRLEALSWRLRPKALLRGRLEVALAFRGADATGDARLGAGLGGALYLEDLRAEVAAAQLASLLPSLSPVQPEGVLRFDLNALHVDDARRITQAQGRIDWRAAALHVPRKTPLGDFSLTLEETVQGGLQGVLRDGGGPLEAEGRLRLDQTGYGFSGMLAAREAKAAGLLEGLRLLGPARADGKVPVNLSGQWNDPS